MSAEPKLPSKRHAPQSTKASNTTVRRRLQTKPSVELEAVPMSAALLDIARPLFDALTPDAPVSDYQRTLVAARLAWNFAVGQELGRQIDPAKLVAGLEGVGDVQGSQKLLFELAARKRVLYPRDRRLVMDATVSRSGADFELTTASVAALER